MPAGMAWFAENQPFTPFIETVRGLLMGTPIGNSAWLTLAWCAGSRPSASGGRCVSTTPADPNGLSDTREIEMSNVRTDVGILLVEQGMPEDEVRSSSRRAIRASCGATWSFTGSG